MRARSQVRQANWIYALSNMEYEEKLKQYIAGNNIKAEHLSFTRSCHSVAEAAEAAGVTPQDFVKNICLITADGKLVVAIVKGEDKASTTKVGQILGIERPVPANPEQMLEMTGYPCGGTPSFGYEAIFLVDERALEKEIVYTGGGSENSLVKISPQELLKASKGKVVKIRK